MRSARCRVALVPDNTVGWHPHFITGRQSAPGASLLIRRIARLFPLGGSPAWTRLARLRGWHPVARLGVPRPWQQGPVAHLAKCARGFEVPLPGGEPHGHFGQGVLRVPWMGCVEIRGPSPRVCQAWVQTPALPLALPRDFGHANPATSSSVRCRECREWGR